MQLLDELAAEHVRIDRVLGALRTYVRARLRGDGEVRDAARFVAFFRLYADGFHHAREEDVLFAALVRELELPLAHGPLAALAEDHRRIRALLLEIAPLLGAELDPARGAQLDGLVVRYSHALWHHIDAEDSVLFPESTRRLASACVHELPGRAPTQEEALAGEDGDALVLRYAPMHDAQIVRGDGCVLCPSYGVACRGLEHEWWNDHEWDEHHERAGHD